MWIIIKILASIISFAVRFAFRASTPSPAGKLDGIPYYQKISKGKDGKILGYRIGVAFNAPILFSLHPENNWDKFFKSIGFSEEFETGKQKFDQEIYISGDHPALHQVLKHSTEARVAIFKALGSSFIQLQEGKKKVIQGQGFKKITCDGAVLWLHKNDGTEPFHSDIALMMEVRSAIVSLAIEAKNYTDPFFKSFVIVEAFVWSIFAFAVSAFVELIFRGEENFVYPSQLLLPGLFVALLLFGVLFFGIWAMLKGSSRGHRIITEALVVLALSLPVAGVQIIADINTELDTSSQIVYREIISKEKHKHRRRRGGTYYSYHLVLSPHSVGSVSLPSMEKVSHRLYAQAEPGYEAVFDVADGALDYLWYRDISIRVKQDSGN